MSSVPHDKNWQKSLENLDRKDLDEAFFDAAKNGLLSRVEYLIEEKKVWPNTKDAWALKLASLYGHLDTVKYLVDKGNQWDISEDSYRAISWAASAGYLDVVKFLISESGCGPHSVHNSVIRDAVYNGQNHVVRFLLETQACGKTEHLADWLLADIMASDKYDTMELILHQATGGTRSLKAAVRANNLKAVRLLLDFRTPDLDQQALKLAEENQYQEIVDLLKAYHDKFTRLAELETERKALKPMLDLLMAVSDVKTLQEPLDEKGKTGFIMVTEAGYLFHLFEKNTALFPQISLNDLTVMDRRGKSVVSLLAERKQLNRLFSSDLWLGRESDLKKLWREIPIGNQKQVDFDAVIQRINKRVLQDKARHRQLNLRKRTTALKK